MKRTFIAAAVLALLTLVAFKPVHAQEGVKIGFRASPLIGWASVVNDSTKTKPDGLTTKPGLGFSFDFVFTYGFSETVGFKTGVNIATKGAGTEFSNSIDFGGNTITSTGTSKTSFTAIEVPLGLKFRSPEIGDGMFIIGHFGMNAEINLQNKVKSESTTTITDSNGGSTTSTSSTEQVDVDGIRLFTTSFVPGVGLDWEFDWGMLEFAVTYHWGLLSFTDPDQFSNQRSRLNYIALNLGYFF
jgi:hypothetical protein